MRVIIVGSGEVGLHVATTLSAERHDVTVVERDEARSAALEAQLDALVITANGASPRVLKDLGAADADLLLAVTDIDEVNVLAATAGHRLGARRTLARVHQSDLFGEDEGFVCDVLGVDVVIDPERATADDLAETLLVAGAAHVEYFADGRIALAEVILRRGSPLVGTVVADRERVRPHAIVGILRHGRAMIPAASQRLEQGDHLFVAAAREDVGQVVAQIGAEAERVRDAVVFGGGPVGLHLAHRLEEHDFELKVIEPDPARARFLAERLQRAVVLQEDALDKDAFLTHGVDRAGAFVACAGDDRTNLLAGLHAKQLGARLCLAVVSSEQYVPLVDALGVDAAFSLRLTTAEAILRYVHSDALRAMHLTISGAEVLDLQADEGARIVGAPAGSDGLLEGCEVGAIVLGPGRCVQAGAGAHRAGPAGRRVRRLGRRRHPPHLRLLQRLPDDREPTRRVGYPPHPRRLGDGEHLRVELRPGQAGPARHHDHSGLRLERGRGLRRPPRDGQA